MESSSRRSRVLFQFSSKSIVFCLLLDWYAYRAQSLCIPVPRSTQVSARSYPSPGLVDIAAVPQMEDADCGTK